MDRTHDGNACAGVCLRLFACCRCEWCGWNGRVDGYVSTCSFALTPVCVPPPPPPAQWLRDKLNIIESAADIGGGAEGGGLIDGVDGTRGLYFVPAFTGVCNGRLAPLISNAPPSADTGQPRVPHRALRTSLARGRAGADHRADAVPHQGAHRARDARGGEWCASPAATPPPPPPPCFWWDVCVWCAMGAGGDNGVVKPWTRREISVCSCGEQSHDSPHPPP
eukprot:COSAG01_NODE_9251_length_2504_cov_2.227027_1_plen_222_part_00